jgi:hypothetical protein
MKMTCAACKEVVELPEKVGVRDTCPSCDAWLHSCVNCDFWSNSRCTEPSAEKVRDPEGINFCEWYKARTQNAERGTQEGKEKGSKEAAEEMWKRLTKK